MKKTLFISVLMLLCNYTFAQCSASFTYTFSPTYNNLLEYGFTNTSTYSPGPYLSASYTISFGDGQANGNFGIGAEHNYAATGTYTVTLTQSIFDSLNMSVSCTSTSTQVLNVAYSPCSVTYTHSVTSFDNTQQTIQFNATNPAGTPGITYNWNYGDGNTGTGANPTHTYYTNYYYTPTVTATGGGCSATAQNWVLVTNIFDCNSASTAFTSALSYNTAYFTMTTSPLAQGQHAIPSWDYGDGTSGASMQHEYTALGTYTVNLTTTFMDTVGNAQNTLCTKTATGSVTISSFPPSIITGNVRFPNVYPPNGTASKVWLVTYDPNTNLLEAVDSTVSTNDSYAYFQFTNVPPDSYRVKAALINNVPPGSSGYIPTYGLSNAYWYGASVFNQPYGSTYHPVNLIYGTVPAGPGFIAGNVLYGANKHTTGGAPENGMLIYLRDANDNILTFTYTDASGNYTFPNLAYGTYSIYPEALNYATTPFTNIAVTGQVSNVNFYKHSSSMTITPADASIKTVANSNSINCYPNPCQGNFNLLWNVLTRQDAVVYITDISGHDVFTNTISLNAGTGMANILLPEIPSGIYILRVKSSTLNYQKKLTIEK